jgi:hypothetical protein
LATQLPAERVVRPAEESAEEQPRGQPLVRQTADEKTAEAVAAVEAAEAAEAAEVADAAEESGSKNFWDRTDSEDAEDSEDSELDQVREYDPSAPLERASTTAPGDARPPPNVDDTSAVEFDVG